MEIVNINGRKALSQKQEDNVYGGNIHQFRFLQFSLLCVSVGSFSSLFTQG